MKKILFAIYCMACALALSGCSSDDDSGNEPGQNPGNNTDYIATTNVKRLKFTNSSENSQYYLIYEDYNRRYALQMSFGDIRLYSYIRKDGSYTNDTTIDKSIGGIKMFLNIANLQELTETDKVAAKQGCRYHNYTQSATVLDHYSYTDFTPGCGYIAWFVTETGEELFVRIRTTGYTLASDGSLESVSIEYQLF